MVHAARFSAVFRASGLVNIVFLIASLVSFILSTSFVCVIASARFLIKVRLEYVFVGLLAGASLLFLFCFLLAAELLALCMFFVSFGLLSFFIGKVLCRWHQHARADYRVHLRRSQLRRHVDELAVSRYILLGRVVRLFLQVLIERLVVGTDISDLRLLHKVATVLAAAYLGLNRASLDLQHLCRAEVVEASVLLLTAVLALLRDRTIFAQCLLMYLVVLHEDALVHRLASDAVCDVLPFVQLIFYQATRARRIIGDDASERDTAARHLNYFVAISDDLLEG